MPIMPTKTHKLKLKREQMSQGFALVVLLVIAGLGIAGPSGLLAWSENSSLLKQREAKVTQLLAERDALKNRVNLLNYDNADPDLASELLRKNLNVVHPDEVLMILPDEEDR